MLGLSGPQRIRELRLGVQTYCNHGHEDALARYAQVRGMLDEARRTGVVLWTEEDRLLYRMPPGGIPSGLEGRLASNKSAIQAELDRPVFRHAPRQTSFLRYPEYWLDFWWESQANLSLANLTHATLRLLGSVSAERVSAALEALAERHELLRAKTVLVDGLPCLLYDTRHRLQIDSEDLAKLDGPVRSRRAQDMLERTIWTRFEDGQVFRACILKLSANETIVAFVLHHFVGDFFSCRILAQELLDLLGGPGRTALSSGKPPLQYFDYHAAMERWMHGPGALYRSRYWERQMDGAPPARLTPDWETEPGAPLALDSIVFTADESLRAGVARVAVAARASVPIVALAANFAALSRALGHGDIVVTLIGTGRDHPPLMGMVGNTVNTFPVRVQVNAEMSFLELLNRVGETYAIARDYQLPWALVMQMLRAKNVNCAGPTFNYMQQRHTPARGAVPLLPEPGGRVGDLLIKGPAETGTVEWKSHELNITDLGNSLLGVLKYASSRYRRERIERFTHTFLQCLRAIAHDPDQKIAVIPAEQP